MRTAFSCISNTYDKAEHKTILFLIASIFVLFSFTSCDKEKNEIKIHIDNETGIEWDNIAVNTYDGSATPAYDNDNASQIYMLKSGKSTILNADNTCTDGTTLTAKMDEDTDAEWYEIRFTNSRNQIQYAYYKPENAEDHSFTVTRKNFGRKFPIQNNPLPTNDTLRVLMIGNSFTDDASEYLADIVVKSGIDVNTCCVYNIIEGYADLSTWCFNYNNYATRTIERKAGKLTMPVTNGTIQELLSQDWDVVTLQQVSTLSNNFNSFAQNLDNLVSYIKTDCTNKKVSICWHMTWSYWEKYPDNGPKEETGWESIVATAKEMQDAYGIDILIPSGTAIQLARNTSLNTKYSLTRDGKHIAYGVGRYILACTVFETLFAPVYGTTIIGNASRHKINDLEKNNTYENPNVTDENATLCHTIAAKAVAHWDQK